MPWLRLSGGGINLRHDRGHITFVELLGWFVLRSFVLFMALSIFLVNKETICLLRQLFEDSLEEELTSQQNQDSSHNGG